MERNTNVVSEHKELFYLREQVNTTIEEIQQIDDLLERNYAKYIFLK